MATNKVATQVRLDEQLHEQLKAIAEKEHRSMNNLIEYLLKLGVEMYNAKSESP
jgi:hypothetical protein